MGFCAGRAILAPLLPQMKELHKKLQLEVLDEG